MSSNGVNVSPKHGLNPSVQKCYFCLKDMGVALFGRLPKDEQAPRTVLGSDCDPCDGCKEYMKQGVILISVDSTRTTDEKNPYRSGGWAVVTDDGIRRAFNGLYAELILRRRAAFLPDEVWDAVGLPRGEGDVADAT